MLLLRLYCRNEAMDSVSLEGLSLELAMLIHDVIWEFAYNFQALIVGVIALGHGIWMQTLDRRRSKTRCRHCKRERE